MISLPLLIFDLDGARFGLDATQVRESIWLPELTPVEEAPPWIVGLFSLRGRIVPVADLHLRFGHPARRYGPSDQVVVLETDHLPMGLIVSEVIEVIELPGAAIQPPPQFDATAPGPAHLVEGEARVGDDLVTLLDVAQLMHLPPAPPPQPSPAYDSTWASAHSGSESFRASGEGVEVAPPARGRRVEAPSLARSAGEGWGGGGSAESVPDTGHFCPEATPEARTLFRARAAALQESVIEDEGTRLGLAVVELGSEYFGVELAAVQEFCDIAQLSPIPCCPPHILGAMNLRGNLFTLIDPRAALNLPPAAKGGKAVVARIGEQAVGIVVDEIHDVVYLKPEDMQAPPAVLRERYGTEITGTTPYAGRMMTVLDLPALLAREEWIVNESV